MCRGYVNTFCCVDTIKIPRMDTVAERLTWARKRAGYEFASDAARAFGWHEGTYRAHEAGARGLKPKVAERYSRAYGISAAWLLTGEGTTQGGGIPAVAPTRLVRATSAVQNVPIVGTVEAGAFRIVDDESQLNVEDLPSISVVEDDRYRGMKMTGFEVRGDSMNLVVPDGGTIVMVDIVDYADRYGFPETGRLVVIERSDGGHTRERTVKEVRAFSDRVELVPRSTNKAHKPLTVPRRDLDTERGQISIIGVVCWSGKRH